MCAVLSVRSRHRRRGLRGAPCCCRWLPKRSGSFAYFFFAGAAFFLAAGFLAAGFLAVGFFVSWWLTLIPPMGAGCPSAPDAGLVNEG